nr:PREDICTED: uncharacterized protein LOC103990079 isoform X3 [Musa acuminata subsp. malaccensis]
MSDTNFSWIRPDNIPLEALLTLRLGSKPSLRSRRKETRRQLAPTMDPRMWHKVAAISGWIRCCCYRSGDLRRSWFQAQEPILRGGLAYRLPLPLGPYGRPSGSSHRQTPQHLWRASNYRYRRVLGNVLHRGLS